METGKLGEDMAAKYLEDKGWRVLERNFRHRVGEIDIVAEDPRGELVFVEVKTRTGDAKIAQHGGRIANTAGDSIAKKLAKMEKVATLYLHSIKKYGIMSRFDIISIKLGGDPEILHLVDVGH